MSNDEKNNEKDDDNDVPVGKIKNITPGGNVLDDSFFDSLGDIDDGLGKPNFSKLDADDEDSISDIVDDDSLDLLPRDDSDEKQTKQEKKRISSQSLPASTLPGKPKIKESMMTKKDPLNLPDDDPNAKQIAEIWESMDTPDASEFKLMVLRLEPQVIKSTKISGYLETFHLPTTIPDIIEQVGQKYGGGKFQIRIVDGAGKYVKSKTFEISGLPKIPFLEEKKTMNQETVNSNDDNDSSETTSNASKLKAKITSDDDNDDEEIDDEEWPDEGYYPRPRPSISSPYSSPYNSPYGSSSPYSPPFNSPYSGGPGFQARNSFSRDLRDDKPDVDKIEEKIVSKIETKFDKMTDLMQNLVMMNQKKDSSFLNADVVKALAPVVVSWIDSKSNRDNSNVGQFAEMNKQMVGLMEGMQNLVRMGDKTREDYSEKERRAREEFVEKERREREQARKEAFEYQRMMEEKFLDERRRAEERHQQMLIQMRDALESKHRLASDVSSQSHLQLEKMREEFREKEERARMEAREREERLREEARKRDEEARRREMEFWQNQRTEEMRWREEMRLKEEEARQRELQWREEIRQREVEKERELKLRELDMMKTIQEMNNQKANMQQKLIEQIYSNNNNNRESQLQMEMAIAKMTSDNETRMLQANAEMQLEKIRHATQMQMAKMKSDLHSMESKKSDDPLDAAMQDYLKRRLQIDMIKELNMDVAEDEIPSGGIMGIAKKLLSEGAGPMLLQMLLGGGGGGLQPGGLNPASGGARVVAPNPSPTPRPVTPTPTPPPETNIHDLDDYDDEDIDEDEDYDDQEENSDEQDQEDQEDQDEQNLTPPDVDLYQEIPRVAQYFEYLKGAIEGGVITPKEAAEEGKARLSPEIVVFLMNIQDSKIVINQLYPLLSNLGTDFANFFTTEDAIKYMDKMLAAMSSEEGEETEEESETIETSKDSEQQAKPKVDGAKVEKVEEKKTEETKVAKPQKPRKKKTPTT